MANIQKRRQYIADTVSREGFANVADLATQLKVTQATIRMDLRCLEGAGVVRRSHGGAIAVSRTVRDLRDEEKASINVPLKRKIASTATQFIEKDDSIIIAAGSTMTALAERIATDGQVNVITPSLRIAMTLVGKTGINVFQLGGFIYGNSLSTRGEYAIQGMEHIHASKIFFGAEGFDPQFGITCATLEEAELTRQMMKSASQIILLADSSKFCRRGFAKICEMRDIDILITDCQMPSQTIRKIKALGVEVVVAK